MPPVVDRASSHDAATSHLRARERTQSEREASGKRGIVIALETTTGTGALDTAPRTIGAKLLMTLLPRIRRSYLLGSYSNGLALPSSDVDLVVVFGGQTQTQ